MSRLEKFDVNGIKGVIHHGGDAFIVCCHGLYSSKESRKFVEMAQRAAEYGIGCVRFDFRGCGESEGEFSYKPEERLSDLEEVMKWLMKKYSNASYALFGSSLGGMVSIKYASKHEVNALVTIATPYEFEIAGYRASVAGDVERCSHILIIHGLEDELVPKEHAEMIFTKAREPKKIIFFKTDHRFSDDGERSKAIDEALKWIKKFLE